MIEPTNYTKKERDQYNKHRSTACHVLEIREQEYNRFRKLALEVNKVDTMYFNGELGEEEYNPKIMALISTIKALANHFSLEIYHQQDPRGASIYLSRESMDDSNYPSRGQVIY